jgi:hypothetical protein
MKIHIIKERRSDPSTVYALERIESLLATIQQQGVKTMAKIDDLKAQIAEVHTDLDEIDGDIQEVLDKLANPPADGLTAEQTAEVTALLTTLKGRTRAAADKVPEPPTV